MRINPRFLFHVQKSFNIGILAVGHNTYKDICFDDFASVRVNDCCRIPCPIYFNLFTGFTIDVHGYTVFLLILLDVILLDPFYYLYFYNCSTNENGDTLL